MDQEKRVTCPCCGYIVIRLWNLVCPICSWEDDPVQLDFPLERGANRVSLLEGQQNYLAFGISDKRLKKYVRPPLPDEQRADGWRPINVTNSE